MLGNTLKDANTLRGPEHRTDDSYKGNLRSKHGVIRRLCACLPSPNTGSKAVIDRLKDSLSYIPILSPPPHPIEYLHKEVIKVFFQNFGSDVNLSFPGTL